MAERLRLMPRGQLETAPGEPRPDGRVQEPVCHEVDQLRQAQRAGHLDRAWNPVDTLVFVSQLARPWASGSDLVPADGEDRDSFMAARRSAVIAGVRRLCPAVTGNSGSTGGDR